MYGIKNGKGAWIYAFSAGNASYSFISVTDGHKVRHI